MFFAYDASHDNIVTLRSLSTHCVTDIGREGGSYSSGSGRAAVGLDERVITEDNVGHKLLRELGWKEGGGLGREGAGIVEPIREAGKKDKSDTTGIGVGGVANQVR